MLLPKSVWLPGLIRPAALLTAILQTAARRHEWPLDEVVIKTEVTKKKEEDLAAAPREGAYVHGLHLHGAVWNAHTAALAPVFGSNVGHLMALIHVKAVLLDANTKETGVVYNCPVYRTMSRGEATFVTSFALNTKQYLPAKWALAGVALLLEEPC
jgi:dynein heavy chain